MKKKSHTYFLYSIPDWYRYWKTKALNGQCLCLHPKEWSSKDREHGLSSLGFAVRFLCPIWVKSWMETLGYFFPICYILIYIIQSTFGLKWQASHPLFCLGSGTYFTNCIFHAWLNETKKLRTMFTLLSNRGILSFVQTTM